jgi:hypothetical protein
MPRVSSKQKAMVQAFQQRVSEAREAEVSDIIPPTELPPAPLPVKRPIAHKVCAWRHDGGRLLEEQRDTLEAAREFVTWLKAERWVTYYKAVVSCGRDIVERHEIGEPA